MKRIGIDTEALKEHFGKKIMELEQEKRKLQVQLQYKMKQEAEQFRQWKASREKELLQLKRFAWRELQIATDNFSERNVLGQGGLRKVYKGVLPDGTKIAVKREYKQELSHYGQKINIILSKLRKQITLCNLQIVEAEYIRKLRKLFEVAYLLRELKPGEAILDWPTRKKVPLGTARGLEYLHEQCNPKIIHRDVKEANVLLDVKAANVTSVAICH
ncbi:LRR receptor kinase SERK2-like [Arachis hypogaea]|uniref:LRR receptor kinase SERK2-like n=1 Tax=Arachis hypogaea TaxID=3818 RepID=UPI003B20D0ED